MVQDNCCLSLRRLGLTGDRSAGGAPSLVGFGSYIENIFKGNVVGDGRFDADVDAFKKQW
jgi:hypothetical protein